MSTYAREYTLNPSAGAVRRPAAAATVPRPQDNDSFYPDTRCQPITKNELIELGIASKKAWDKYAADMAAEGETVKEFASRAGVTLKALQDDWRHRQVKIATDGNRARLSDLMRADFRAVKAHFLNLAGLTEKAFALLLRTGKQGATQDVVENAEQADHAITTIFDKIVAHFSTQDQPDPRGRAVAFFRAIAAPKEKKYACGWRSWDPKKKWQLYFTLKNRLQAIMEKDRAVDPSFRGRNKSQNERRRHES